MKFVCVLWGKCVELSLAELRAYVEGQGSFFEVALRDGTEGWQGCCFSGAT